MARATQNQISRSKRDASSSNAHSGYRGSSDAGTSTHLAHSTRGSLGASYSAGPAMGLGGVVQTQEVDATFHEPNDGEALSAPVQEKCAACEAEDTRQEMRPVQQQCEACKKEEDELSGEPVQLWDCSEYEKPTCLQTKETNDQPLQQETESVVNNISPIQSKCDACEAEEEEETDEPVQLWDCTEYEKPTCVQSKVTSEELPVQDKCASCESEEQVQHGDGSARNPDNIHQHARNGLREANQPLPHGDRIQASFGRHDISHVRTNVGGGAASANRSMGSLAFTSGSRIGFRESPSLHLAAHEAAHVVQQKEGLSLPGNVGRPGDQWERHADKVADAVASGCSAEPLLNQVRGSAETPEKSAEAPVQQQITSGATRLIEPPPVSPDSAETSEAVGAAESRSDSVPSAEPDSETQPETATEGSAMEAAEHGEIEAPPEAAQAETASDGGVAATPAPASPASASGEGGSSSTSTTQSGTTGPTEGGGTTTAPAASEGVSATPGDTGATTESANATEPTEGGGISASCYSGPREEHEEGSPEPTADERGSESEERPQVEFEPWPDAVDECPAETAVAEGAEQMPAGGGETLAAAEGLTEGPPESSVAAGSTESGEPAVAELQTMTRAATAQAGTRVGDSGMEGPIASAQAARETAVNDYLESNAGLDSVMARSQTLESRVTLPDAQGPQQVEPREATLSIAQAFMARMTGQITQAVAFVQDQVPDRLGGLAEGIKANIQGAMEAEKATISARIAQAQALARAGAAAARAHIHAEYASSAAQIESVTLAAITALDAKHLASLAQVDEKETSGLDDVNTRFQRGREQHEEKGPEYSRLALRKGQDYADKYERCKGDKSDDGFWDGCLTVRRARAQQDAACKTAAGYRDTFLRTANKKGYDLIQLRKQYRCAVIAGSRQVNRTLDDTHDSTVSGLESGRAQAMNAIGQARDQNLASIDAALSATLQSLAAQEASQRQSINDTGYLKQLAVEQLAHAGAAGLARGVNAAMESLEGTLDTLRQRFVEGDIPDPAALSETLGLTEAGLGGGIGTLLDKMEQGASQAEGQLDSLGVASLEALMMITQKNDELSTQAESSFAQQMNGLKSGATETFAQLTGNQIDQTQTAMTEGTASMDAAVTGFDRSLATIGGRVDEAIATSLGELDEDLRNKLSELDEQIPREAQKAAEKEQPAWKSVVAIVLIIVVIIAAAVISIVTLGAGASLFAIILVGALVGAVSAGLIQIINNWASGAEWSEGVVQAMVIGAIGGAIGGGLGFAGGALASGVAAAGGSVVRQLAITVGADLLSEGLTQTFAYVRYGQDFNWQGFVMAGAMSGVSFRAHPSGARPTAAASAGGRRAAVAQIAGGAALGMGIEYATAKISGQEFDLTRAASAAASGAVGARMSRRETPTRREPTTRIGRAARRVSERVRTSRTGRAIGTAAERVRSFDPGGGGASLGRRLQGVGARMAGVTPETGAAVAGRPRVEEPKTTETTHTQAPEEPTTTRRTEIGEPETTPTRRPISDETAEALTGPARDMNEADLIDATNVRKRIGDTDHDFRITRNGPEVCTSCDPTVKRLTEMIDDPNTPRQLREELMQLRRETGEAKTRMENGEQGLEMIRESGRIAERFRQLSEAHPSRGKVVPPELRQAHGTDGAPQTSRHLKDLGVEVVQTRRITEMRQSQWSDIKLKPGEDAIYIVRDVTSEPHAVLKVGCAGPTCAGASGLGRFSQYRRAANKLGLSLEIDVAIVKTRAGGSVTGPESALRTTLENEGNVMPWDATRGRLGRDVSRGSRGTPFVYAKGVPFRTNKFGDLVSIPDTVASMLHQGKSIQEIADHLSARPGTVSRWINQPSTASKSAGWKDEIQSARDALEN